VYRFTASGFAGLSAASINENGTVTVSGSFHDPGTGDAHTVTIDWKDGSPTTLSLAAGIYTFSASHQYLDDTPSGTASDVFSVRVRVLDATPDLAVVSAGTNSVLTYDASTGVFKGALVASGSGGLTSPQGVAIGPDGDIYISSGATGPVNNAVLHFDAATGA